MTNIQSNFLDSQNDLLPKLICNNINKQTKVRNEIEKTYFIVIHSIFPLLF